MKKLLIPLIVFAASTGAAFVAPTRSYTFLSTGSPHSRPGIVVREEFVGTGTAFAAEVPEGQAASTQEPAPKRTASTGTGMASVASKAPVVTSAPRVQPPSAPRPVASQPVMLPPDLPTRLIVPAIGLDAPVQPVGVNSKGEMDVPDGDSGKVGWYKGGTMPGDIGSAVMDAHVYALFSELKHVRRGDDIYVVERSGSKRHFVVEEVQTRPLAETSAERLFNRDDARRLNLITCAGTFIPALDTYDQRLVVYAKLVSS